MGASGIKGTGSQNCVIVDVACSLTDGGDAVAREKFWVFSLATALAGVLLLVVAENGPFWPWVAALLESLAGILLASVALGALWEYTGRRAFLDLVLERVGLAKSIERSGLLNVTNQYLKDVPWDDLIRSARHVDLLFSYARTWRSTHQAALRDLFTRSDTRIRIVLPDHQDEGLMEALGRSYDKTPDEVREGVLDALAFFEELRAAGKANVSLKLHPNPPAYSYYRFDDRAIITLYRNSVKKGLVPVLDCRDGGVLFQMTKDDFGEVLEASVPANHDDGAGSTTAAARTGA